MDDPGQAALVRRCQDGDAEAFRALVEAYKNALFGVAFLMTRDRGMAEDAIQEALVQIWKHLPSLRDPARIKSWMMRIVVNEVNQQLRKKRVPSLPIEAADIPCDDDPVENRIISAERRRKIQEALSGLPREQREAIVLRFYSDLSVPEIAAATGAREGTIKSRLHRALENLNEALQNEGLEAEA
ncbi:RNA polymerase sigma factor [Dehalogenimonas etheniformans]|uniref:RNA polymerase sigma factor n=1 Tax=Dehalogenimonas etheniformans TaxID=1536648 RepID=UPI0013923E4E|nr:sigma-70 family RNA polymerase sigma factor [Dehalogenimonas etheniformans]QNT76863.1 sigma-70 family RNA polymerase sigma factor [Dehalogenimonas etheniformans]